MPPLPSERSFGFLFSGIFALVAVYGYVKDTHVIIPYVFLIVASSTLVITLSVPKLLTPFNKGWFWLGYMMGRVVSPLVLGLIFFGVITPVALITRIFGRDELRLKRQKTSSYWIGRTQVGTLSDSFKNQF